MPSRLTGFFPLVPACHGLFIGRFISVLTKCNGAGLSTGPAITCPTQRWLDHIVIDVRRCADGDVSRYVDKDVLQEYAVARIGID